MGLGLAHLRLTSQKRCSHFAQSVKFSAKDITLFSALFLAMWDKKKRHPVPLNVEQSEHHRALGRYIAFDNAFRRALPLQADDGFRLTSELYSNAMHLKESRIDQRAHNKKDRINLSFLLWRALGDSNSRPTGS